LGQLGINPAALYTTYTLRSLFNAVRGAQQAENARTQAIFEAARLQAYYNVNLWAKEGRKLERFTDLICFPWEEEQQMKKPSPAAMHQLRGVAVSGNFKKIAKQGKRIKDKKRHFNL